MTLLAARARRCTVIAELEARFHNEYARARIAGGMRARVGAGQVLVAERVCAKVRLVAAGEMGTCNPGALRARA